MTEAARPAAEEEPGGPAEVARLNKIIQALMDRAERDTRSQISDFGRFPTTITLEDQLRQSAAEQQAASRSSESAGRALRQSEAKFRGLVGQSLVGIVLIEEGKFSYSNAKFDEIFGYSSPEIRTMGPLDTAVESDRALVAKNIDTHLNGAIDQPPFVFHGLRKDGTVIDVECHSSMMNVGDGPVLISLVMDISERTRAGRAVQVLQDELREQSTHDSLTGLFNRHFLDETFGRELLRSGRADHPVGVIMGDLDHFKAVNDRYGHLAGDEVLRAFGAVMTNNTRASDIACRYGGDEFLLVLPGMSTEGSFKRAEQLREAVAAMPVSVGATQLSVTASFGVATFPVHGHTSEKLVAAADEALYEAKAAGRNRTCVYGAPVMDSATALPEGHREP